jgi:hypothetical protein
MIGRNVSGGFCRRYGRSDWRRIQVTLPRSDRSCRIASYDCPGRNVFEYDGSSSHDGSLADRYSGPNERPGGNPGVGADLDRPGDNREIRRRVVVRGRTQDGILADDGKGA